ncbi:MAG TPA: ATP-binding protein [Thermoanaerobaculia bacterium]|nr:ATP-binding protein [Thermoanaerobaculia bacterium]
MEAFDALYRVCLIGPECTGKTTVAARLAERYGAAWVPEFAREYAERVARPLTSDDVSPIAKGQLGNEERAVETAELTGAGLLILDTDLVSTYVYARHYYGAAPDWLEPFVRRRLANHYLLFSPDCPFVNDAVRDSAADRRAIHDAMSDLLDTLGAHYTRVGGGWEERWEAAVRAVEGVRR